MAKGKGAANGNGDAHPAHAAVQERVAEMLAQHVRSLTEAPPVVYDKGDYHAATCAEHGLDPHQAHVHTGMFVTWLIDHDHLAGDIAGISAPHIAAVKARTLTGPSFYEHELGGTLADDVLTAEGNAFAQHYFDLDHGTYLADYNEIFAVDEANPASAYGVADTWASYEKLRPRIDQRYEAFRAAQLNGPPTE